MTPTMDARETLRTVIDDALDQFEPSTMPVSMLQPEIVEALFMVHYEVVTVGENPR